MDDDGADKIVERLKELIDKGTLEYIGLQAKEIARLESALKRYQDIAKSALERENAWRTRLGNLQERIYAQAVPPAIDGIPVRNFVGGPGDYVMVAALMPASEVGRTVLALPKGALHVMQRVALDDLRDPADAAAACRQHVSSAISNALKEHAS